MMSETLLRAPKARIVAISGGLGAPSSTRLLVDRIRARAEEVLRKTGVEPETTVVELRDLLVPIANHLVTSYAEPALAAALESVRRADGIIAVTPVFNGSMAGHFKSFFDLFTPEELDGVPVVLGATGGSARHSLVVDFALRPLFAYLRARAVPTGVFVATADWGGSAGDARRVDEVEVRATRVARELAAAVRSRIAADGESTGALVAGGEAPTISATRGDRSDAARETMARRAESAGFAELMTTYAGVPRGFDAP